MPNTQAPLTILYHHRTRSRDGQSVHIDEIVRALSELGHNVIVVGPKRVAATQQALKSVLLPPLLYELAEFGYNFVEFAKLSFATARYRPDVLYERANLFMLSGLWTARIFKLPYLLEVNAPLAQERGLYGSLVWKRFAQWTERICWRGAAVVFPVTAVLARNIREQGVPDDRIAVTPNGVGSSFSFKPDNVDAKAKLGLKGRLILGFVGYLRDWHGLDGVVDILATRKEMQSAYLLVVGDGPARSTIERRAQLLGVSDRVRVTGTVPRDDLPSLIAAFDIALQPKVTPYASPLKLFEYMALGRAIVAPASPNIMEILEDGIDAVLYPEGDEKAFAEAVAKLANDASLREQLGQAAAQKVIARDLTWRGNARRIAETGVSLRTGSRIGSDSIAET